MHEKLIKQLRNTEHCYECPYDEDCNEFDSCLMDLLAADAIEDMSKRIARLEKELQEKDKYANEHLGKVSGFLTEFYWYEHCDKNNGDKCEHGKCQFSVLNLGHGQFDFTCGRYSK